MPRGPIVYSLPAGTVPKAPLETIKSAEWNAFANDVQQTFNTAQPIAYGGTGANTAAAARTALFGVSASTDNAVARFDGVTGSLQNSGVIIDDFNNVSGVSSVSVGSGGITLAPVTTGPAILVKNAGAASAATVSVVNNIDVGFELQTYGTSYVGGTRFSVGPGGQSLGTGAALHIGSYGSGQLSFYSANFYRGKFTSGTGYFLVGATSSVFATVEDGVLIGPAGDITSKKLGTGATSHMVFGNNAGVTPTQVGSITSTGSTTTYNTSSDGRLKPLREDFDAGAIIDALNPVHHNWKDFPDQWSYGLIAQEAIEIVPTSVSVGVGEIGDEDFVPMGMDYSKYVPILIKNAKEARAREQTQDALIADLMARLAALEGK